MEDKRYLAVFDDMAKELSNFVVQYNQRANGLTDKEALLALRAEQYEILSEIVQRHKRTLAFHQGKPVEPQHHFGEAILLPVFGQG